LKENLEETSSQGKIWFDTLQVIRDIIINVNCFKEN
jgi:hypothetical protein